MKNWKIALIALAILACGATATGEINPSGIWYDGTGNMNYIGVFSWGENPMNNAVYIIDLGDPAPYLTTGADHLFVTSIKQIGNRIIFYGDWGLPEGKGSLTAVFSEDGNTMYFESTDPVGRANVGSEIVSRRVPIDAPVIPIDPVKGP
jgi:hypothetical protein